MPEAFLLQQLYLFLPPPAQEGAGAGEQGQCWVTGEEPIQDGEWADAGCFRHDSGALGTWEQEGGPRPVPSGRGTWDAGAPPSCHATPHATVPVPPRHPQFPSSARQITNDGISHLIPPSLTLRRDFLVKLLSFLPPQHPLSL